MSFCMSQRNLVNSDNNNNNGNSNHTTATTTTTTTTTTSKGGVGNLTSQDLDMFLGFMGLGFRNMSFCMSQRNLRDGGLFWATFG